MGTRCPWSQAQRWVRACRQRTGDHVYGTFSCGSTGADGGTYRCSPDRRGDCRHAQLGIQDHPPISGFPVRGRGLRGRACNACWAICVPIRIPVRQGIGWDCPVDPPKRGIRGTRRRNWASCHPPSSPSIGGWPRGDICRGASPILVPPRWPSCVRHRAPASNVLLWGSGASATRSGGEYPKRPPLRRETCEETAWPPSSLRKCGGHLNRNVLWAAGQLAGLLISWLWWTSRRIRHSRSRNGERRDWKGPLLTCCGTRGGANCGGTCSDGQAVQRATTVGPTSGSSCGGAGWRRLQTALECANRYGDPEVVRPLLLLVTDAGDFVGTVVEVLVMDLWPAAMYAKDTVAIKDLVKDSGTQPATDKCAPERATEGGGDEPSDSDSSTSSSESSLGSARSDAAAKKSDVGERTVGTHSGKRAVGTFVVGVRSTTGRQPRGGGGERKRGPVGTLVPRSTGRAASGTTAPKRWTWLAVGGAVRVHGPVPGGPKVVLGGGSVAGRPAARGRLHRRGTEGPAGSGSSPKGASAGGGVQRLLPVWRVGKRRGQHR